MRRPLLLAVLILGAMIAGDRRPLPQVSVQTRHVVGGASYYYQGQTRQRLVIGDRATWAVMWPAIASTSAPIPAVDFTRDVVILAASGIRSSGGFEITIDDIVAVGDDVHVTISEHSPDGCFVTAAMTSPVVAAVTRRASGTVIFHEREKRRGCW